MKTNTSATLFNRSISSTGGLLYTSHVIPRVAWEGRVASNRLASRGDLKADQAYVYIPFTQGRGFLTPDVWNALSDKGTWWTLQEGDVLVKGEIPEELGEAFTLSDLRQKYTGRVIAVSSVDPMDNGSLAGAHWKVAGS